jgi:hypothetical protein
MEKTLITKEKEEKMGQINTMKTEKGLTIGQLECAITPQTRRPSYYDY